MFMITIGDRWTVSYIERQGTFMLYMINSLTRFQNTSIFTLQTRKNNFTFINSYYMPKIYPLQIIAQGLDSDQEISLVLGHTRDLKKDFEMDY